MATVSSVVLNEKRKQLEKKYRGKREELKRACRESYKKGKIPFEMQQKLQSLPRNANPTRLRNRCQLCGRPRSVYRRFGLCRFCIRILASSGYIPGLRKSSW